MLTIKDEWGNVLFKSEDYEKLVRFAEEYKKKNKVKSLKVTKQNGRFHSFV